MTWFIRFPTVVTVDSSWSHRLRPEPGSSRCRFAKVDGIVDLKVKGAPGHQPEGFLPWFDIPERASREVRVICGHWSTLGFKRRDDLLAIDTGCVWGGSLTAVNLDANEDPILLACNGHLEPGGGEEG